MSKIIKQRKNSHKETKFKVGDIITCIEPGVYSMTNEDTLCIITEICDEEIVIVKVIMHKNKKWIKETTYDVLLKYFKKVKPSTVAKWFNAYGS